MTAEKWQAGHSYAPGEIVQPKTAAAATLPALTNGGFESGDTDWTKGAGWAITSTGTPYAGTYFGTYTGTGTATLDNPRVAVVPGWEITARAMLRVANSADSGRVIISWQDTAFAEISVTGDDDISTAGYAQSVATGKAPATAAYAQVKISATSATGSAVSVDDVQWELVSGDSALSEFLYQATQAAAALSAATEPVWPTTLAATVVDNGVTWTTISANIIRWEASPVLETGATQPAWPTEIGVMVPDGTIAWECISRRIEDENCPHSKVVQIAAGKVYAGDDDIIRYCATIDPLDWTSINDAGYLPFGLQTYGANPVSALGLYRGDLIAFNTEGFQRWAVDENPALSALVDALPLGSSEHMALTPVGNDLLVLTPEGVRDLTTIANSNNLQAGALGKPVDTPLLAQAALATAAGKPILGTYWPGAGQAWFATSLASSATVFVCTMNRQGQPPSWSRYTVAFPVDAFAQLGDTLYLRTGDRVLRVDPDAVTDSVAGVDTAFAGTVQYHWLDFGQAGVTKQLEAIDYVGTGQAPALSIGYDQRNPATFTAAYQLSGDTLPGTPIPFPIAAPTLSLKLTFAGGAAWSVQEVLLLLDDARGQP